MLTLKHALKTGELDRFIAERKDMMGDEAAFNRVVGAMAQTSKEVRPTSSKDGSDD